MTLILPLCNQAIPGEVEMVGVFFFHYLSCGILRVKSAVNE